MPASVSRMRGRYPHPAAASPRSNLYSHHGPSSMARPHPCCQVRTRRPGCHPTASGFWRGLGLCVGVHPIHPTCRGEKYLAWLCERLIPCEFVSGRSRSEALTRGRRSEKQCPCTPRSASLSGGWPSRSLLPGRHTVYR